jgi:hypothetical protein
MQLHRPHLVSAARYPVLRSLAILYMAGAAVIVALMLWRAVRVLLWGADMVSDDLFGATRTLEGRLMVAASWLASAFIGAIVMLAIAELIKLLMDIERNTRAAAQGPAALTSAASAAGAGAVALPGDGAGRSSAGGRVSTLIEGEETAEGALLRGH